MRPCIITLAAMTVMFGAAAALGAGDGTWTSTTSGLWSDGANWSGGTVANGWGYTAYFYGTGATTDVTVSLDSARVIGKVTFGNYVGSNAAGWTMDNNGNSANILTLAGSEPTIWVNQLDPGKTATISLEIAGTAGLAKSGVGTLVLSGANTYSGITKVLSGTLRLNDANALPGGTEVGASGSPLQLGVSFQDPPRPNLNGGVLELAAGNFTRSLGTSAGQVFFGRWTGGGFSAAGADRIVNIGGASAPLTWGSTNFLDFGSPLILIVGGPATPGMNGAAIVELAAGDFLRGLVLQRLF
jgi:autotransporter-associated beta strand protein